MNEGKLLYSGAPQELTQRMAGRTILLRAKGISHRKLLQRAICLPSVSDGVIQGKYLRLILKENADHSALLQALEQPEAELLEAEPRFEDAFIDLLGGGPDHESELAKIMPQVKVDPAETVIEAQQLTKKFGDFAATDTLIFRSNAAKYSVF
jgi:ABC-2 type transport system ATP-binding protein